MKRIHLFLALPTLLLALACSNGSKTTDGVITQHEDGRISIQTDSIARDIQGFEGPTPITIEVKDDKVTDLTLGKVQDDPEFINSAFDYIKEQVVGKTLEEIKTINIDGYSGATYSSEGIIKTIKRGAEYATTKK